MQEEFERKRGLFDDDLAFIREVKEQETAAAGMDPDTELQTLHKRFSNWKHEFKVSMCSCATFRLHWLFDLFLQHSESTYSNALSVPRVQPI